MEPLAVAQVYVQFGPSHWIMLALTALGGVLLVLLGRRHRGTSAADRFARVFGITILVVSIIHLLWGLVPANFDLVRSVPIHLSDLLRFVAGYALITQRHWATGCTYYWGLTLNPQAMITPSLVFGPAPAVDFIAYWLPHMLVMWATLYLVWGLGAHPDWRSYRTTTVITVCWAAVAFMINSVIGTNYGYLNEKPSTASLLDLLGPWPFYLLVELALVVTVWALLTWPWTSPRRPSPAGR